jgi:hypothetical protein
VAGEVTVLSSTQYLPPSLSAGQPGCQRTRRNCIAPPGPGA